MYFATFGAFSACTALSQTHHIYPGSMPECRVQHYGQACPVVWFLRWSRQTTPEKISAVPKSSILTGANQKHRNSPFVVLLQSCFGDKPVIRRTVSVVFRFWSNRAEQISREGGSDVDHILTVLVQHST